jgi:hypothetical protein
VAADGLPELGGDDDDEHVAGDGDGLGEHGPPCFGP